MFRLPLTGQVAYAACVAALTLTSVISLPTSLRAQAQGQGTTVSLSKSATVQPREAADRSLRAVAADAMTPKVAASNPPAPKAANPAPEPNTLVLLGTGSIVLLGLYTRRRVRALAPTEGA